MGNYYCLVAGLPDIDLADIQPGFSFEELREWCDAELSAHDRKLISYFYLRLDCKNLVKLLHSGSSQGSRIVLPLNTSGLYSR